MTTSAKAFVLISQAYYWYDDMKGIEQLHEELGVI